MRKYLQILLLSLVGTLPLLAMESHPIVSDSPYGLSVGSHTLYIKSNNVLYGHVSNEEMLLAEGERTTLWAYPTEQGRFIGWYIDGALISEDTSLEFVMGNHPMTLEARFAYDPESPESPYANTFDASTGYMEITNSSPGRLYQAITKLVDRYSLGEIRELTLISPMNEKDWMLIGELNSLEVMDLSRATGITTLDNTLGPMNSPSVLHIPAGVHTIKSYTFNYWSSLQTLYCYSLEPPTLEEHAFSDDIELKVFVPAEAIERYKAAPGWRDLNLAANAVEALSVGVTLPSGVNMTDFNRMVISLTNLQNGQRFTYVMSDRMTYTFNNILPNTRWRLEVRNSRGDLFGSVEEIQLGDKSVDIAIENLTAPKTVSLTVRDPEGKDVTGDVGITWMDEKEAYLSSGKEVASLPVGTRLSYKVDFEEKETFAYERPGTQSYTVKEGSNAIVLTLSNLQPVTVTGVVIDSESKRPIEKAGVSASQTFYGKYTMTQATETDAEGRYTLELQKTDTRITIGERNHQSQTIPWNYESVSPGGETLGTVSLVPLKSAAIQVAFDFTATPRTEGEAESATSGYPDYRKIVYTVYNETRESPVDQIRVEHPQITLLEGVEAGDEVTLTATSPDGSFVTAKETVTIGESYSANATLRIIESGAILASYGKCEAKEVVGILYDAEGNRAKTANYIDKELLMEHVPDGRYTLVTMKKDPALNSVSRLGGFAELSLTNGVDYAAREVSVSGGKLTTVSLPEVPVSAVTKAAYWTERRIFTDKQLTVIGNNLTVSLLLSVLQGATSRPEDIRLVVDLPEGCEFLDRSVTGYTKENYTLDGNQLTIPVPIGDVTTRFTVTALRGGKSTIAAMIKYKLNGNERTEMIGSATFEAVEANLSVPKTVSSPTLPATGKALPGSTITVYDGDKVIGETKSDLNGQWGVRCQLIDKSNLSKHLIEAVITTPEGKEIKTGQSMVVLNQSDVDVSTVKMYYSGNYKKDAITFDFQKPDNSVSYYLYILGRDLFTFTIDFTDNDPGRISEVILYVKMSASGWKPLVATYNEKSRLWVATLEVDGANDLPVNVSVDFKTEATADLDADHLKELYDMPRIFQDISVEVPETDDTGVDAAPLLAMSDEELLALIDKEPDIVESEELRWDITEERMTLQDGREAYLKMTDTKGVSEALLKDDPDYIVMPSTTGGRIYLKRTESEMDFVDLEHGKRILMTVTNPTLRADLTVATNIAIFLNLISTIEEGIGIISGTLKRLEMGERMNYKQAESALLLAKAKRKAAEYRIEHATGTVERMRWHDARFKALQEISRIEKSMARSLTTITRITKAISFVGQLIDIAVNAYNGYHAMLDWREVLGQISACTCPGMDELYQRATRHMQWVFGFFYTAAAMDVATVAMLATRVGFIAALATFDISLGASIFGQVAHQNWLFADQMAIPGMNCDQPTSKIRLTPKQLEEKEEKGGDRHPVTPDATYGIDPSGYVYEGVFSNRVEGARTTIFYKETVGDNPDQAEERIVKWDASVMGQKNPLYTDANGFYRWDVPKGLWQVKYEKEGYETAYSDWLPVPPPQLDVNMNLREMALPMVQSAVAYQDAVEITFSKYMIPGTLTTDNIKVYEEGTLVEGEIILLDEETGYEDETESFASKVRFNAASPFSKDKVTLSVRYAVTSYAGVEMQEDYRDELPVEVEITEIKCDNPLSVTVGETKRVSVEVLPREAGVGKQLEVSSDQPAILAALQDVLTLDDEGKATLTVEGLLPGEATLTLSVKGVDKRVEIDASVKTSVKAPEVIIATGTPIASLPDGSSVERGSSLTLSSTTAGATIYYTLDGSCPCDASPSRMTYTGSPIVLDQVGTVTLRAMAVAADRADSEVATYTYWVFEPGTPDGIEDVTEVELTLYPLPVTDLLNIRSAKEIRFLTLLSLKGAALTRKECASREETLRMGHLPSGMYLLVVEMDGEKVIRKVIKR